MRTLVAIIWLFPPLFSFAQEPQFVSPFFKDDTPESPFVQNTPLLRATDDFSVLGRWAWGPCRTVKLVGRYALVGQGYLYQVFDVSNPSAPVSVYDTTLSEPVYQIEIADSVLYILTNATVIFADARQLFPLRELGRYNAPVNSLRHISVSDTLMYLLPDWALGFVVSIAQLANPYFLASFPVGNTTGFEGTITSKGRFVYYQPYCPCAYYVLEYLPDSNYFRYRSMGGFVRGYHSLITDTLLLVGTLTDFRVYSIADQWIPRLLGSLDVGSPIRSVATDGKRAFAGTESAGIVTISITEPEKPYIVARTPSGVVGTFAAADSLLAVASEPEVGVATAISGFHLYSTAASDSLRYLHYYPTPYPPAYDITLRGNIGFSNYSNGIWSVDYADLGKPRVRGHTLIPTRSQFARSGDLLCFISQSGNTQTFAIARIGDGGSVTVLSQTPFAATVRDLEMRDTLLLLLADDSLSIYSIANSSSPQRLGKWVHGNSAGQSDIDVVGNVAYLSLRGNVNRGLVILDICNPSSPQFVTSIFQNCFGVLVHDTIAYVFTAATLNIVNVFHPNSPQLLSTFQTQSSRTMERSGRFLFVLHQGLNAVDVSDPYYPRSAGEIPSPNLYYSNGIAVSSDTLFIANSLWNIGILKHDYVNGVGDPRDSFLLKTRLWQNYPNPFNSRTSIEFEISARGRTNLTMYDMLGRKLAVLADGVFEPGRHTITWSSEGMASGVYIYRLRTEGGAVYSKCMVLLK